MFVHSFQNACPPLPTTLHTFSYIPRNISSYLAMACSKQQSCINTSQNRMVWPEKPQSTTALASLRLISGTRKVLFVLWSYSQSVRSAGIKLRSLRVSTWSSFPSTSGTNECQRTTHDARGETYGRSFWKPNSSWFHCVHTCVEGAGQVRVVQVGESGADARMRARCGERPDHLCRPRTWSMPLPFSSCAKLAGRSSRVLRPSTLASSSPKRESTLPMS